MAGFFPHIGGVSTAGFTPLPTVAATGILDSIVSDIGAGVNGWSVFDDQRTTGAAAPYWGKLWYNGIFNENATTSNAFTFTTGSAAAFGNFSVNSFYWPASISALSGTPSTISLDQSTTYTIWATTQGATNTTATLDRNYSGATTTTNVVYEKITSYVVLKHTGGQKTFYVFIGMNSAKTPGPYLLRVRAYETWDASTHAGTNGGQEELVRAYNIGNAPLDAIVQYVMFLYADAITFWVAGIQGTPAAPGTTQPDALRAQSHLFHIGNLDTTGVRTGDSDALWAGFSDTSFTGISPNGGSSYNTTNTFFGGSQCLRTLAGVPWNVPTAFQTFPAQPNTYSIFPRGLSYVMQLDRPQLDISAKFEFCDIDVYHAGMTLSTYMANQNNEGRRGTLRYLKCPGNNPSGLSLGTFGPADDGNTYIMLVVSYPYKGDGGTYGSAQNSADTSTSGPSGSSFSWMMRGGSFSDLVVSSSTWLLIRYFMMPIL